jgi:hypothetical protein
MYSRPGKDSHEETIWYEIEMLEFCFQRLKENENKWPTTCDFYVYLEAYLLHYRNLVACFSGQHHRSPNKTSHSFDVDFSDLSVWTSRKLSNQEVGEITGPAKQLDNEYFDDISQFLSHVTSRRSTEEMNWKVTEMNTRITPILKRFLELFPATKHFCRDEEIVYASLDSASTETRT